MIGGAKTEQEIIDELNKKGKFDEWASLGSYFGLTSNTLKAKCFFSWTFYFLSGK